MNITARLLDAMTGKRWLAYSTDSSRVYQFDIDFYCSEFRHTRIFLVISLCLDIIYREMGRNLPVCEDVVQVVFILRSDGLEPLSDPSSFRENLWGLMKCWIQKKNPRNLQELDKVVVESFMTVCTKRYCDKLYGSMPGRLDMVIESGGFRINE